MLARLGDTAKKRQDSGAVTHPPEWADLGCHCWLVQQ
jgi:hypothetical protein